MTPGHPSAKRIMTVIISVAILGAAFYQRAASNLGRIDYTQANFVFFWLSGRMVLSGQNPYDSSVWLAAHDANGVTGRPNLIFLYPLPLAALVAPLGMLSLPQAYLSWQLVSMALIAGVTWLLLSRQHQIQYTRLFVPLVLVLLFFGPVLLSLQIGSLGAFTLAAVVLALAAFEGEKPLLAGLALSLTLLKPPQGIPIVFLIGIWLLARQEWRAVGGIGLGTLGLLLLGMLIDPHWLGKFGNVGQALLDRSWGLQSNTFGFAYHACAGSIDCMWLVGGAATALTMGVSAFYLWRRGTDLRPWEAINLILPTAFLSTLYLWSYDQILYIIPLIWIILRLIDRTHSYLPAFGFLLLSVGIAFIALFSQATTRSDLLSVLTTALVLAGCLTPGLREGRFTAQADPPPV